MKKLIVMLLTVLILAGAVPFGALVEGEQDISLEENVVETEFAGEAEPEEESSEYKEVLSENCAESEPEAEGAEDQTEPEQEQENAEVQDEISETAQESADPIIIVLENDNSEDSQDVDVREEADGMSAIITSLPEGAEVIVLAIEGDWVTVLVDGVLGYIYVDDIAGYLDLTEDKPAEVPDETQKKVTIFTSRRSVMEVGEPVYLTSKLEGFEDCEEILFVWYVDKGNGFEIVEGANEATYTFAANAESLTWGWQLEVLYR